MILQELRLQNFRSYAKKTCEFSPETTLVIGPNTAGKTNILEAIMFLATGKSFRAGMDREAIRWGSDLSTIKCRLVTADDFGELELFITKGEVQGQKAPLKKYLVNGVPRRTVDFVGNLRAVLFWPEHLELVTDSPSLRRRYLDSVLVQVDREYQRNLLSYERGLRQRNRLLDLISEGKAGRQQLLFWNQLLVKAGGYMTEKRAAFLHFVNQYSVALPQHISTSAHYHIDYDRSVISEERLDQYKDEEVAAKATLVGPHRDDFSLMIGDISLASYGSRGEQRLGVLWLKLAELSYITEETGERPILLLDDIFSEFDEAHRDLVVELIGKQQTILTSADKSILEMISDKTLVLRL
ncbi:MAG: DNA replication and repair protein RecF [bacterium]|nr:DNA replication and repair protein RecF [bacterium]